MALTQGGSQPPLFLRNGYMRIAQTAQSTDVFKLLTT